MDMQVARLVILKAAQKLEFAIEAPDTLEKILQIPECRSVDDMLVIVMTLFVSTSEENTMRRDLVTIL